MKKILYILLLFTASCTTLPDSAFISNGPCETDTATLDADFSGAGMTSCTVTHSGQFVVRIEPEKEPPINPSPWYAVRVTPKTAGPVDITFHYMLHKHRYHPKISSNQTDWRHVPEKNVTIRNKGKHLTVALDLKDEPIILSGQELFLNHHYEEIISKLEELPRVARHTIGQSVEGRNIDLIQSKPAIASDKFIMLVGRQHPPEVTGALAMTSFIATIMGKSPLAQKFRDTFNIVMVPNMNPDGVEHGFWRLNVGGVDLNRDWGPFTQPETRAVKSVMDDITENNGQFVLFLDFHSTNRNVFYTQTNEDEPTPYDFTGTWLKNSEARLDGYNTERAERHNTDLPTSKNYMAKTYDIPAITYELGDETDRALIKQSAEVFAEEMMKILLTHH